jgi:hypothetical protein
MYYLIRTFSGGGHRSLEEHKMVVAEMLPHLVEGSGLRRFKTFALADGRIGSSSVYRDKQSAQQGMQIAKEWAAGAGAGAMQKYELDTSYEGEIATIIDGDSIGESAVYEVGRIYTTSATADEVGAAIGETILEDQAQERSITGRVRTVVVQLGADQVGTFSGYSSESASEEHSRRITEHRSNETSRIRKLTPSEPTIILGAILTEDIVDQV